MGCLSKPGKLSRPRNYNEQGKSTLSKPSKLRPWNVINEGKLATLVNQVN